MKAVATENELSEILAKAEAMQEIERIGYLSQFYYDLPVQMPADPYSPAYIDAVKAVWERLTLHHDYDPHVNEANPEIILEKQLPAPYGRGDSSWLGESWVAWGFIMLQLKLPSGAKVIEYGPGWGTMALALARNGCDVTAVDIEPAYLGSIREQAAEVGATIHTYEGSFGEIPPESGPFDAVVFLESFHHCLDHASILRRLHDITTPDAVVCLGDEPVFEEDSFWLPTTPFPWGPRTDLLSIRSGRKYGWLELGFQESYVIDVMLKTGWLVEKRTCPVTRRGTCYLGKKLRGRLPLTAMLPSQHDATWYPAEALGRWSKGKSTLPVLAQAGQTEASIEVANYRPKTMSVELRCGPNKTSRNIKPGEIVDVTVGVSPGADFVEIVSDTFVPDKEIHNGDTRHIGVFVHDLRFR